MILVLLQHRNTWWRVLMMKPRRKMTWAAGEAGTTTARVHLHHHLCRYQIQWSRSSIGHITFMWVQLAAIIIITHCWWWRMKFFNILIMYDYELWIYNKRSHLLTDHHRYRRRDSVGCCTCRQRRISKETTTMEAM